jgi:hypothetical protein
MSFNNPYMQKPDYGQGFQDVASQVMQMLLMKKMFPGQGGEQAPDLQAQGMAGAGASQGTPPSALQQMGQFGFGPLSGGFNPAIMQLISQLLSGG